jgi:hypothetical protein
MPERELTMKRNKTEAPPGRAEQVPTRQDRGKQDRAARLEAELKANLKKRKDQARARALGDPPVTPGEKPSS